MSGPSTPSKLLAAALISAALGAVLFVASVFMPQDGSGYVPAVTIAIVCATSFVILFGAYLVSSRKTR